MYTWCYIDLLVYYYLVHPSKFPGVCCRELAGACASKLLIFDYPTSWLSAQKISDFTDDEKMSKSVVTHTCTYGYSGRKRTESIGNVTIRGEKRWKE
jgi:hypothetical protein